MLRNNCTCIQGTTVNMPTEVPLKSDGIIASWLLAQIMCKKGWHKHVERILRKTKLNLKLNRYLLLRSH